MTGKKLPILLLLVAMLALGAVVLAQSSAGFDLSWHVVAGGGGRAASADYVVQGTIGQALAGPPAAASADFRVTSGFWQKQRFDLFLPLARRR